MTYSAYKEKRERKRTIHYNIQIFREKKKKKIQLDWKSCFSYQLVLEISLRIVFALKLHQTQKSAT